MLEIKQKASKFRITTDSESQPTTNASSVTGTIAAIASVLSMRKKIAEIRFLLADRIFAQTNTYTHRTQQQWTCLPNNKQTENLAKSFYIHLLQIKLYIYTCVWRRNEWCNTIGFVYTKWKLFSETWYLWATEISKSKERESDWWCCQRLISYCLARRTEHINIDVLHILLIKCDPHTRFMTNTTNEAKKVSLGRATKPWQWLF